MRLLLVFDPHLHTYRTFGYDLGTHMPKRLLEQSEVLGQVLKHARQRKVDLLGLGGDLFHKMGEIPTEALNVASSFFQGLDESGIPYLLVRGNHDLVKRENASWFHSATEPWNKYKESLYPKIKLIHYDQAVKEEEIVGYDLVIAHKELSGVAYGNGFIPEEQAGSLDWKTLAKNNKLVFLGHFHIPQKLAKNCWIGGSPMHLSFGDRENHGCYLVDTDTSEVEFIPLDYPMFLTVASRDLIKDDGNYYRIFGCDEVFTQDNVVSIVKPPLFEERIKAETFEGILLEWLTLNQKDASYLTPIQSLLGEMSISLIKKLFKGKLTSVRIQNFCSIAEAEYSIERGFTLLSGRSDVFSSNGSGKTSLLEAILWGLFGQTSKGLTGDDVVQYGKKDCQVTLRYVDEDGTTGAILRSRKHGLQVLTAAGDPTEGMLIKQAQEYLEKVLLGFDSQLFRAACFFSQENVTLISSLSDSEKTNMITDLLGFDQYEDLREKVVEEAQKVQTSIEDLEKEKMVISMEAGKVSTLQEQLKQDIAWHTSLVASCNSEILLAERGKEEQVVKKVPPPKAPASDLGYEAQLTQLQQKTEAVQDLLSEFDTSLLTKELSAVSDATSSFGAEVKLSIKTLNKLQELKKQYEDLPFGQRCDKCNGEITKENIQIVIEKMEVEIEAHLVLQREMQVSYEKGLAKQLELKNKLSEVEKERSRAQATLTSLISQTRDINTAKSLYEYSLKEYELQVSNTQHLIEKYDQKIGMLKKQIASYDSRIADNKREEEQLLAKLDTLAAQLKEKDNKIQEQKNLTGVLEFWKMAFSSMGIRSVLLDRFCNEFNTYANEYLSLASVGKMSIILTPTKQLKTKEERNKIGLSIYSGDREVKYESLSGGEKRRVDFSLCLAINKWVAEKNGVKGGLLGFIVFDELFSMLDRSAEEAIAEMLKGEGVERAVFVITHTPDIANYADRVWLCEKIKGVTKLIK